MGPTVRSVRWQEWMFESRFERAWTSRRPLYCGVLDEGRKPTESAGSTGKTENSEFSIFVSGGTPTFSVHLGGRYANARGPKECLQLDRWYHLAGVFDGSEVRLYLDGVRIAQSPAQGSRRLNGLPLLVGADPDNRGRPMSFFQGQIDEVRITEGVRYVGERFHPKANLNQDEKTQLLLGLNGQIGPFFLDLSRRSAHAFRVGGCTLSEVVPSPTPPQPR